MLDFRMLYFNHDRRLPMTDVINPFIISENSQRLGNRFVDAGGTNFNRVFNLLEIETGHLACLQGHKDDLSCFAFYSSERQDTVIDTKEKAGN